MNYRKIDHWDVANLGEGLIYCIQRLDELLFDYTIDSYKPRALNPPSLCIELLNAIDEVEAGNIDINNIKFILEELNASVKTDKVAKKLITSNIEYFTNFDNGQLSNLKLRISVLERSLERYRYIKSVQEDLFQAIKKNHKNEINTLIGSYVTTFINWGISKQFLYNQMNKFFFDKKNEINSDENLIGFFEVMFPKKHTHSIYFKISKNITLLEESFNYFNIRIIKSLEGDLKNIFEKFKFKAGPNDVIVEVANIRHPDPYVSRNIAENKLETIRNTSQLYFHQSRIKWYNTALVIQQCCKKEALIAKTQINPMQKSFNHKSNDVAKNTNKIFQHIALEGESFQKFNRAMELHSNCLLNLTPENQLVNLWTIFETIIPSSNKKSKVQQICDSITPILLVRYFNKLIANLLNDFIRWNKELTIDSIKNILPEEDNLLHIFTLLLSKDDYVDEIDKLYASLGDFYLLRNRTFNLSQTLKSKEKILNNLERHKMNVVWQIRRIYRTRNMVVHSGKSLNYINILVENTHDYIDQLISEIIDMTTSNYRIYNLEQAFEFGKILNNDLMKKIKNSSKVEEYISDIIREKIILSKTSSNQETTE